MTTGFCSVVSEGKYALNVRSVPPDKIEYSAEKDRQNKNGIKINFFMLKPIIRMNKDHGL